MSYSVSIVVRPLFLSLFVLTTGFAQDSTVSLKAIKINGDSIPPKNSITVNPGDVIHAEVFASDWSPNGERLKAYDIVIPRSGFSSGASGTVLPLGWDRAVDAEDDAPCQVDSDCPAEWPVCLSPFGFCVGPDYDPSMGVFVDDLRADWVLSPCNSSANPCLALVGLDISGELIRFGGAILSVGNAPTYSPPEKYVRKLGSCRLGRRLRNLCI